MAQGTVKLTFKQRMKLGTGRVLHTVSPTTCEAVQVDLCEFKVILGSRDLSLNKIKIVFKREKGRLYTIFDALVEWKSIQIHNMTDMRVTHMLEEYKHEDLGQWLRKC